MSLRMRLTASIGFAGGAILGVNDDVIAEDYELSNRYLAAATGQAPMPRTHDSVITAVRHHEVHALSVHGFLHKVRGECSSMCGFARAHGIDGETLARIRENLLTQPAKKFPRNETLLQEP